MERRKCKAAKKPWVLPEEGMRVTTDCGWEDGSALVRCLGHSQGRV